MSKWFEGKADAPVGVIPGVGHSGPGVKIEARDAEHEQVIKDTGYFKASTAPSTLVDEKETTEKPAVEKPASDAKSDNKGAGK